MQMFIPCFYTLTTDSTRDLASVPSSLLLTELIDSLLRARDFFRFLVLTFVTPSLEKTDEFSSASSEVELPPNETFFLSVMMKMRRTVRLLETYYLKG